MLGFLTGGKVDHPMADAKQAREIINELPSDALKALDEITQLLESLRETRAYKVDRLYENIDLLDGAAKNHQRKIAQDYFATARQQKFQENRLWTLSYMFWKALSDAYLECVDPVRIWSNGRSRFSQKTSRHRCAHAARPDAAAEMDTGAVRSGGAAGVGRCRPRVSIRRSFRHSPTSAVEIYPGAHGSGCVRRSF